MSLDNKLRNLEEMAGYGKNQIFVIIPNNDGTFRGSLNGKEKIYTPVELADFEKKLEKEDNLLILNVVFE